MDRIRQTVTTVVTVQPSPRAVQITLRPSAQQQQLPRRSVGFSDDVVDNEHLGKRKSKCCCIYHKPTNFDDTSSESDSDSDSSVTGDEGDMGESGSGPGSSIPPAGGGDSSSNSSSSSSSSSSSTQPFVFPRDRGKRRRKRNVGSSPMDDGSGEEADSSSKGERRCEHCEYMKALAEKRKRQKARLQANNSSAGSSASEQQQQQQHADTTNSCGGDADAPMGGSGGR